MRMTDNARRHAPERDDIVGLASRVTGPVLTPGDAGFEAETATYILGHSHRATVAVGATSVSDVQEAVLFAARHDLPIAVVTTGHGAFVSADASVLINTSRMNAVHIDPAAHSARVAAGVRWQQLQEAAALHGLVGIAGSSPTVGVIGYTLGGGVSPTLGRRYGFAADHVTAAEIVTADGRFHRVDAHHEPELFWALRGGKGNFGVVTALEFRLVPHTRLYGGGMFFAAEHVRPVIAAYRRVVADAPDDLTVSFALLRMPDLPFVPEPLRGRFSVHVRVAFLGPAQDGEKLIEPLRDAAPRLFEGLADMPFLHAPMIHNDPVDPVPAVERSELLTELTDEAIETLLQVAGPEQTFPALLVEIRHLGGALARDPELPNAVGHRGARFNVFAAGLGGPDDRLALSGAFDALIGALRPWTTGHALINFLSTSDAVHDRVRDAYEPQVWTRLTEIKAAYDPTNLFRINFNIAPTTAGN